MARRYWLLVVALLTGSVYAQDRIGGRNRICTAGEKGYRVCLAWCERVPLESAHGLHQTISATEGHRSLGIKAIVVPSVIREHRRFREELDRAVDVLEELLIVRFLVFVWTFGNVLSENLGDLVRGAPLRGHNEVAGPGKHQHIVGAPAPFVLDRSSIRKALDELRQGILRERECDHRFAPSGMVASVPWTSPTASVAAGAGAQGLSR